MESSIDNTGNSFSEATSNHNLGYEFIQIGEKPFPANILSFRKYSGVRVLALIVFLWVALNSVYTLYDVTFNKDKFRQYATVEIENRGVVKKSLYWAKDFFWQETPKPQQIEINTQKNMHNAIFWQLLKLALAWCVLWLSFDWHNAKNLVFAAFSICIGIAYSLLPVDAIPDFIPAAGQIDDICANIFGSGIGFAAISEYVTKRRRRETIMRHIRDNPQVALSSALEDYGISVINSVTNRSK